MKKYDMKKSFILITNVQNECYLVTSKNRFYFPPGSAYQVEHVHECIVIHSPKQETQLVIYAYT